MVRYGRAKRWKPYPELVAHRAGSWTIRDSREAAGLPTGMADLTNRVMALPLTPSGSEIACHELAHVRWSRAGVDLTTLGMPLVVVQAVEDARVNLGLANAGQSLFFGGQIAFEVLQLARRDRAREDAAALILRGVAALGTNLAPQLDGFLVPDDDEDLPMADFVAETIEEVRWRLVAATPEGCLVPTFDDGLEVARWLARRLELRGWRLPDVADGAICLGYRGKGSARKGRPGRPARGEGRGGRSGRPGQMQITRPPRPLPTTPPRCLVRMRGRRRPASEGTELAYIERFVPDGRIFRRTRRGPRPRGGSILIDTSGSMHLSPEDIEQMIAHAPDAALVAAYSGDEGHGELRIVVADGHRVTAEDLDPPGHGNVVDLPALEWLAEQPEPRIWISDGRVTGCGDRYSDGLREKCRAICQKAGIVRVDDAESAAAELRRAG